jgi:hypothetical protein
LDGIGSSGTSSGLDKFYVDKSQSMGLQSVSLRL